MEMNLKDRLHNLFHPTKEVVLPGHDRSESELLIDFERGRRLAETVHTDGWRDVTAILEDIIFTKVFDLINYKDYDKDEATLRQKEAHMAALIYDQLMLRIKESVAEAEKIPQLVATQAALRRSGNLTE